MDTEFITDQEVEQALRELDELIEKHSNMNELRTLKAKMVKMVDRMFNNEMKQANLIYDQLSTV